MLFDLLLGFGFDVFGMFNVVKGDLVVFGVFNFEFGFVIFFEVFFVEQVVVFYVNVYKGGIGGYLIKLIICQMDGIFVILQCCVNQIFDQKLVVIFGVVDMGVFGVILVWENVGFVYFGGVFFILVEQNSKNVVIFLSVLIVDNVVVLLYVVKMFGVKLVVVIYILDIQGISVVENVIILIMNGVGISKVIKILILLIVLDVFVVVVIVFGVSFDVIYINVLVVCLNILNLFKQFGNMVKILGIDFCILLVVIVGVNGGVEGLYFVVFVFDLGVGMFEIKLYVVVMKKYVLVNVVFDLIVVIGFQMVMDVQVVLGKFMIVDFMKDKIFVVFMIGLDYLNFMGYLYICDGMVLLSGIVVCNSYEQIWQIKGGKVVFVGDGKFIIVFGKQYFYCDEECDGFLVDILFFVFFGFGVGLVYVLFGFGLVFKYWSIGVIDFVYGVVVMFSVYVFVYL